MMENIEGNNEAMPGWESLPDLVLENVFSMLDLKARYRASVVCKNWYESFYTPHLWQTFCMDDGTLTKRKKNMYGAGYVTELSRYRLQKCLSRVGQFTKHIVIKPMFDYYSLYGFLHILTSYLEFDQSHMLLLESFSFTFACQSWGLTGSDVHGTGGKMLRGLEELLAKCCDLKSLTLNQLLLVKEDALNVFDGVLQRSDKTLTYLELLNCTKRYHPMYQVAFFHNLSILVISPQNVNDDIVLMLAAHLNLDELRLTQDLYTDIDEVIPVTSDTWQEAKNMAPEMALRLEAVGNAREEIVFQPHAPVTSILYHTSYLTVTQNAIETICGNYSNTLVMYGNLSIADSKTSNAFDYRPDSTLCYLIRNCPNIHTLIINEWISSGSLLLIVSYAKKLKKLHVRSSTIIEKMDCPKNSLWSDTFYEKLKGNSLSVELMSREISFILGYQWKPLTDDMFSTLHV